MKICPLCNAQMEDEMLFCTACGARLTPPAEQPAAEEPAAPEQPAYSAPAAEPDQPAYSAPAPEPQQPAYSAPAPGAVPPPPPPYGYAPPQPDPFDHTAEFDAQDISDNKICVMMMYLFGFFGVIVALLMHRDSPYLTFHLRQWMKLNVTIALMWVVACVLSFLVLPLIAAMVMTAVFGVIEIIMFVQVCQGKAKEPAIVRSLTFLK